MVTETTPASATVGAGNVLIKLMGKDYILVPNYNAAKLISQQYGGIAACIDRVVRLDVEAVTTVITLGLGYSGTRRPPKDLGQLIYETGLTDDTGRLAEHCIKYLRVLASGGKAPTEEDDQVEGGDNATQDPPQ